MTLFISLFTTLFFSSCSEANQHDNIFIKRALNGFDSTTKLGATTLIGSTNRML